MKGYVAEDMPAVMSALWAQDLGPDTYRFVDPPQDATPAPESDTDPESLI